MLVYYNKFLLTLFLCIVLSIFIDNNANFILVTTICYSCFCFLALSRGIPLALRKKAALVLGAVVFCITYAGLMYSGFIVNIFPALQNYTYPAYKIGYSFLKAHAAFFMSLYYLGGSMSFLSSTAEYVIFVAVIACLFKDLFMRKDPDMLQIFLFFLSCVVAFNIILLTIPNLNQGRYYYFFLLALFISFDRYWLKERMFTDGKLFVLVNLLLFVSVFLKIKRFI
jgi:hypothetical protein